jgi:4-amino-4-deoxy-L-arabinose transferase-like glycosyltransferase
MIPFIVTLIVGIFLRIYNIGSNYYFTGELGKELLYLRQFSLTHTLPLIGMPTSHEWLSYGPFYYWIMMPIFNLFTGNPFILFWSALVVSILGMVLNYFVVTKIVNRKVALISTIIQSISPLFVWQTKLSKLHTFFFILSPIFMYGLYQMWQGKKKWVFWTGLTFGLMFSFHFSQIPLLGVVVLLFWNKRDIYKFLDWVKFGLGVMLPNLTLLWHDKALVAWLPYRVANISHKDPLGTIKALNEYLGTNIFWNEKLWVVGTIFILYLFLNYFIKNKNKVKKDFLVFYLITSIGIMMIANILHGAPPIHYFLPIFTTLPILVAVYLSKFKYWKIALAIIFLMNLRGYFTSQKLDDYIPFYKQLEVANFIVMDAKGGPLSIKRVGPYDYFPEQYSQNYKYLILWKGGNLVETSGNTYTIVDNGEKGEVYVQK